MSVELKQEALAAPSVVTSVALTRAGRLRLEAIDLLRGFVIVLMVLDHVRDFFHVDAFVFNPTDPERTTLAIFATRWVTHLCAPTFVFLAGASAYLQGVNGKTPRQLAHFLAIRGIWLIVLELTLVGFALNFAPILFLQVIWAIGASMLLLSLLVRWRAAWIGALGLAIVAGHGLLAPIDAPQLGTFGPIWRVLFEVGPLGIVPGIVAYPLVPWFGILCLGYGLGFIFTLPVPQRHRVLAMIGSGALVLFVLLRAHNGYGDPVPWRSFGNVTQTVLSFFNVSKYPPSLLFTLVTLGFALLALPLLARLRGPFANVLLAFGRTPLFVFVIHLYLAHAAAMALGMLAGVPASDFTNFVLDPSRLVRAHWGYPLLGVYAVWLAVLLALYPMASWFAELKRRRRDWWLSYL